MLHEYIITKDKKDKIRSITSLITYIIYIVIIKTKFINNNYVNWQTI